ncbi:MAG: hypothetical protein QM572_08985 [Nocardioides sp.]|uniref:hypothetical protein n=1 Tax=Nocardioides sp. TaxID=35761 RepID=UPI0039E5D785
MRRSAEARRRAVVVAAAVLALLLIWGGSAWWHAAHRSGLVRGLELVPGDAQRISWTDWSAIVDEVGATGGTDGILDRAYAADLSSVSALVTSASELDRLGLHLSDVEWELFAQADDGAVEVLKVADPETWAATLKKATDPELGLTPELQNVELRDGLVITSDNSDYATKVADRDMVDPNPQMVAAASALRTPLSAVVYSGDYTCGHLAMSQADELDQAQARVLLEAAGGVDPMTGFAMGYAPDAGHVRVAMQFENDATARHDADSRATLATGDAPGQGGTFRDRFRLGKVEADGSRVTMDLTPRKDQSVLSDLSSGPVLWASC